MRFRFIATEKAWYPVALMCRVLKVSRSGYYAWCKRPAAARALEDQRLVLEVAAIHAQSDITYVRTFEGWLYLAIVLDLFSRQVVGWSLSERLQRGLALEALGMALKGRRPAGGMLHHSDRGSQYAGHDYQQLLAAHGILSSMSRSGNCWDNAVAESFFATLKLELVYETQWRTREQARSALFEYIELFYNRQRRHSALGYLCPSEFERRNDDPVAA